jgi:selenide,water dikinase
MNPTIVPIEKNVVLVGAGNAHLVFVKRLGMKPMPGVAVTLVSEAPVIPYSAMVPGYIGGDYRWDEVTIDLVRLCQAMQVRLVAERVARIDPVTRRVFFANRPPLVYDALSIGIGSLPACPGGCADQPNSLTIRPMARLMQKLDELDERLKQSPGPLRFVVVGGGVSGCELALAIHKRLGRHAGFQLTLLQGNDRLVPEFSEPVGRLMTQVCQQVGVACRVNARVTEVRDFKKLVLANGETVEHDVVLWATQAAPLPLIAESGLSVDANGFLRVRETLQSIQHPEAFGTGDCVAFDAYPTLPRNGVHAVREGAVLFDNIGAFLHEQPLRPFRPQRFCLSLMNTADREAILNYGPVTYKGRWVRRLKDNIDRAWIEKFTKFKMMPTEAVESPTMRCGGCGSKISSDVLSAVLKRLDIPADARIVLGCRDGEDAAAHRVRPELYGDNPERLLEVQTVDYFKAFIDDPYRFGRIAALHAVSDLYAMNARPFSALALATLPYGRGPVQEAQLYELLAGALESFRPLGVVLTGGHTTEGNELALGFAITGFGDEARLFRKSNLKVGDQLILTKPLGTGALLAAWMRSATKADWFERMMASMLLPNDRAATIFAEIGVTACTDVTGFGLAGHLLEMLDASRVSARLSVKSAPLYEGFSDVVAAGIVSTLHGDNSKVACRVQGVDPAPAWLFDPQTAGGLLAAVRPVAVADTLARLRDVGCEQAAVIGEVVAVEAGASPGILLEG